MPSLIQLCNVSKHIAGKRILDNISFTVQLGELTTLIGPNGAGKSTIARLILRLEPISAGKIIMTPNLKVGYVPQKLETTKNLPITVRYFVSLLAPYAEFSKNQELLEFADFYRLQDQDISQLSGGQTQKILLATTLMNNPDLLILDEPTQSLDVQSQQEFYRLIDKLRNHNTLTVFMISHDLHTVMKNADQVICINGHVCCSGRPSDITHDQEFISALSAVGFYAHHHDHKH